MPELLSRDWKAEAAAIEREHAEALAAVKAAHFPVGAGPSMRIVETAGLHALGKARDPRRHRGTPHGLLLRARGVGPRIPPMMTAAAYVSKIVEPTIEDFRQHRADLRRGMLASMAVLHVLDFVMQNREATPQAGNKAIEAFKKRVAGAHVGFDTVKRTDA